MCFGGGGSPDPKDPPPLDPPLPTVTIINNVIIIMVGGCAETGTTETCDATSLTSVVMGHLEDIN